MTAADRSSPVRILAKRPRTENPRQFTVLVYLLTTSWVFGLAFLFATQRLTNAPLAAGLAALLIAAESRDQLFSDETSMSGSIAVAAAAIVALHAEVSQLGPFMCASCAGLYWPHIRSRAWSKMMVNTASVGFSGLAGALTYSVLYSGTGRPSLLSLVLIELPTVLAYWVVNSLVLGTAATLLRRGRFVATFLELVRSETQMLGFAVLGGMCGLFFLDVGVWAGVLGLVALLAAVDVFAIRRPRPSIVWTAWSSRALLGRAVLIAGAVGAGWLTTRAGGPVVGFVVGLLVASSGAFVNVLLRLRRRLGIWDTVASLGVVIADAHLAVIAATGGVVAAEVGVVAATLVVVVAAAVVAALGARLRRRRAAPSEDEALVLAAVDLALLDHFDARSPR